MEENEKNISEIEEAIMNKENIQNIKVIYFLIIKVFRGFRIY